MNANRCVHTGQAGSRFVRLVSFCAWWLVLGLLDFVGGGLFALLILADESFIGTRCRRERLLLTFEK
jgi:hypothetical protein